MSDPSFAASKNSWQRRIGQFEYKVELERTKANLQKSVIEHEIRYRNVHEKVAETIAETFSRLLMLHRAVGSYVAVYEDSGEPSKEEKLDVVREANNEFNDYFFPRQIYLPPDLCEKTVKVYSKLRHVTNRFTFGYSCEKAGRRTSDKDYWAESFDKYRQ